MPDEPTTELYGQSWASPELQAGMSMLSLLPTAMTLGWIGSIATAGSLAALCENGLPTDPLLTSTSAPPRPATAAHTAATRMMTTKLEVLRMAITARERRGQDLRCKPHGCASWQDVRR